MKARVTPRTMGLIVGLGGIGVITAVFFAVGDAPTAVPALLLLLPIVGAALLADWRIAVPVAFVAGLSFSLALLPPVGTVRIGFTQDVLMAITFLVVAVAVGVLASRRSRLRRQALLDEERIQLLRAVAHDLRNPLHTIHAVSGDLLESDVYDAATREELLTVIHGESERLDRIVGNLLSVSRLQARALLPDRRPEPVAELIAGCVDRMERLGRARVISAVDDDVPDVVVDRVQIDQVLANLIENAGRCSPAASPIEIRASRQGSWVTVTVDDHGPGFPHAQIEAPFAAHRSDHGSTGLGLVVCKAIIEAHGGTIGIGVNAHGGARVGFSLPTAH